MTLKIGNLTRVHCFYCGHAADHDQPGFEVEDSHCIKWGLCAQHLIFFVAANLKPVIQAALDA